MLTTSWVRTSKRLISQVCSIVLVQYRLLPKLLATLHTHVRFLSRVYSQVLVQNGSLPERFITEGTVVRFLASVYPHVLLEVCRLSEELATVWTHVRPVTAVGAFVLLEPASQLEALAAHRTLERFVLLVVIVVVHGRVCNGQHCWETRAVGPVFAGPSSSLVGVHHRHRQLLRGRVLPGGPWPHQASDILPMGFHLCRGTGAGYAEC